MSSARIDIIFYKLRHRAYSRYVDGNVSRMASPTDEYRYLRGQQKAVPVFATESYPARAARDSGQRFKSVYCYVKPRGENERRKSRT